MDEKEASQYNTDALREEIERREKQVSGLRWALEEHRTELKRLRDALNWKLKNGGHNQ